MGSNFSRKWKYRNRRHSLISCQNSSWRDENQNWRNSSSVDLPVEHTSVAICHNFFFPFVRLVRIYIWHFTNEIFESLLETGNSLAAANVIQLKLI